MPLSLAAGFESLRVASIRRETDDAVSLTFEIPGALRDRFAFRPGQFLTLRAAIDGEEVRRSYSICTGLDDGALRVAVKRVDGGRFSAWVHDSLAAGHSIEVMPPEGRFTVPLDDACNRTYLGIAAGSGITPILSILKTVLAREKASRFILLYGSQSTARILFRTELEALKDRFMGRLSVVHVLSREQQDIPVLNGRLDAAKLGALLHGLLPGALPDVALLCGPNAMTDALGATLIGMGMPQDRVLSERFGSGAPPSLRPRFGQTPAFAMATIIADGVATAVPLQENETVLDGALRAGLDLPYSCHAGMCSTCRARVTAGAVVMSVNYGLEPWETEAGYVLTCQAHPTTAQVTVDYDQV